MNRFKSIAARAALVAGVAAIPVAGISTAAWAGPPVCETNGHQYCAGAPSLAFESPITETVSGRSVNEVRVSGTYNGYPQYQLRFTADTSRCFGVATGTGLPEVKSCGATGTTWFFVFMSAGHDRWGNVYESNTVGESVFLAGDNHGDAMATLPYPYNGWYEIFQD